MGRRLATGAEPAHAQSRSGGQEPWRRRFRALGAAMRIHGLWVGVLALGVWGMRADVAAPSARAVSGAATADLAWVRDWLRLMGPTLVVCAWSVWVSTSLLRRLVGRPVSRRAARRGWVARHPLAVGAVSVVLGAGAIGSPQVARAAALGRVAQFAAAAVVTLAVLPTVLMLGHGRALWRGRPRPRRRGVGMQQSLGAVASSTERSGPLPAERAVVRASTTRGAEAAA